MFLSVKCRPDPNVSGLVKVTTETSKYKRTFVSDGKYMYVENDTGGYDVVRSKTPLNPFPKLPFNMKDFEMGTVSESGSKYIVTLSGGKLAGVVDRLEVTVDPGRKVIESMTGYTADGQTVLTGEMQYQDDPKLGFKKMTVETRVGVQTTRMTLEVLMNNPNVELGNDTFVVVK